MGYEPKQPYGAGQPQQPPSPYGQPPTQYNPPPDYGQQPYNQSPPMYDGGVPPMPNYEQPRKKSSLRWLWITLAVVGGLLVLGYAGIGYFAKTIAGPGVAVTAYYQNIKDQNYNQAYTYMDTSGTVQSQFVNASSFAQVAQAQDQVKGPVTAYSQTNISTDSTNGVNTASVTMSVTRKGPAYAVQLELKEENGVWKITSFDNI